MIDKKKLVLSLIIPWLAGGIGSFFTFTEITTWYASLNKPAITPPNWFFGPIWTTLYTLMGIAFYFVWIKKSEHFKLATVIFGIQLVLNALWSVIFFGFHQLVFGLVTILQLWFMILANIIEFRSIDRKAGDMLFPYLAWVTAATILNFMVILLNP